MKNIIRLKIFSFLLLCLSSAFASEKIPAKVISIIDGDTIKVLINEKTEKVRLIGIDTPESKPNKRAKLQAKRTKQTINEILELGQMAKKHLQSYIYPGDTVYLEFDAQKRDKYGRLLAYVWTNGIMVNEKMICDGYAYPLTIPPNVKYANLFRKCFAKAVKYGFGLWKKKDSNSYTERKKPEKTNNFNLKCKNKKYCYQMKSCEEAKFYLNVCGIKRLDRDRDGIPCEKLCK
ncbi:thermonuclease family protein [Persephonella sp. KM09-Lau-8]|uniref:thermonuclease family protein n=1 Tax=Persephonella sp. KM09-Lau-8 TaxID=1158345 RepID=UPI0009DE8015|nr:thermonuclease family protein [Persephonella sp. KM09-Lau-8]